MPLLSGSVRAMPRPESAEAINAWVSAETARVHRHGRLNRGFYCRPTLPYRVVLQAVRNYRTPTLDSPNASAVPVVDRRSA